MKIYARDQGGIHSPPDSLVFEGENTWGIGANVVTSLLNKEGDVSPSSLFIQFLKKKTI